MNTAALLPVPFHTDTLYLVNHEGEPYVPLKPICDNLGLSWPRQYRKIMADQNRWSTVAFKATVAADNKSREMLCIHLRKFFAWLTSIEPSRVKATIRAKIVEYQNHCDDVLWKYWTGQLVAPVQEMTTIARDELEEIAEMAALKGAHRAIAKLREQFRLVRIGKGPLSQADHDRAIRLIWSGCTVAQIARELNRSESCIRDHTAGARAAKANTEP